MPGSTRDVRNMCAEPGARLPSPDAAATRSVCAKDLVELFGGDHHYIRDFPPEALADPPSNWNILAQRDAAQRVAGAAVLEIEDRPPTLPACVPSRITGRGVAVRGETGIRAVATHLLQQVLSDLDRQWPGRLFHLASRYRWLVDGALATGFRRLDTMAYLEHRLHRMTSLEPKHTLRSAQPEDLPQLAAIDARAFPNFWHMGAQRLNQLSQSESARLLVADADGQAAGFILTETVRTDGRAQGFVVRVCVDPALHRQGVGTSLMAGAVNAMHGAGMTRVSLNALLSNEDTLAFYRHLGFVAQLRHSQVLGTVTGQPRTPAPRRRRGVLSYR